MSLEISVSVLILTHNRPELFKRCIESVFSAFEKSNIHLEILVNNDSNDIEEITHDDITIKYFYDANANLSLIYKSLFDKASKEYIYYLEDDDILNNNFFDLFTYGDYDIYYGKYVPYNWHIKFIKFFKLTKYKSKEEFLINYNDEHFQLGQMCFRKSTIHIDDFPIDNTLESDFKLFKLLKGTFIDINKIFYTQTLDGNDNISFPHLNKDNRWKITQSK